MYETLKDCCTAYYGWEAGFIECMSSQGGDAPTQSPIEESWYVDWQKFKCVESCEGDKPCGGVHNTWDELYASKEDCCAARLFWRDIADCVDDE